MHRPDFRDGFHDGLPIGLGYLAVSFAYGLFAVEGGLTPWSAALISLTNVTSAGQFAGTGLFFKSAAAIEIFFTVLLINLRYMLMSLSLTQRLRSGIGLLPRLFIGYGVTDEIYAMAALRTREISVSYMAGLMSLPVAGWTLGTLLGGVAGTILPLSVRSALGIALYAMFMAIIIPPARQARPVLAVVVLSAVLSITATYAPGLRTIPSGWRLIGCTMIAALAGALAAPIQSAPSAKPDAAPGVSSEAPGGAGHA